MADLKQIDWNGTSYNIGSPKYRHNFEITLAGYGSSYDGRLSCSVINSNPPSDYSNGSKSNMLAAISDAFVPASGMVYNKNNKYYYSVDAVKWDGTQLVIRDATMAWLGTTGSSSASGSMNFMGAGEEKLVSSTQFSYTWLSSETII